MAGLDVIAQSSVITMPAGKMTALQIKTRSHQGGLVREISVTFGDVDPTDPSVLVEIERQSDTGSGGDALTLQKLDPNNGEAIQTTALEKIDGSSQPTQTATPIREEVQAGDEFFWEARYKDELPVPGGASGNYLGVAITPQSTVKAAVRIVFQE